MLRKWLFLKCVCSWVTLGRGWESPADVGIFLAEEIQAGGGGSSWTVQYWTMTQKSASFFSPHPGLKVKSESLPDLFPQGNKNEISQIPSFVSFLSCCIPYRILCQPCQGSCPQWELCQGKENLEAGVLQSQNFLPTRASKWILVNFDESGLQHFLPTRAWRWILLNCGGFWLQHFLSTRACRWILVDFGSRESFAVQGMGALSEQEPERIGLKQFFNYFFK